MKSVTKTNFLRGVPETPAYLKDGYRSNGATPGLPRMESSGILMDGESDVDTTPVPNIETSSAQDDTPLPVLSRKEGGGGGIILGNGDEGQGISLREQMQVGCS